MTRDHQYSSLLSIRAGGIELATGVLLHQPSVDVVSLLFLCALCPTLWFSM